MLSRVMGVRVKGEVGCVGVPRPGLDGVRAGGAGCGLVESSGPFVDRELSLRGPWWIGN